MADETNGHDKREAFVRLAEARTNKVLNDLRLIGNLSGGNYSREDGEVEAIFDAIRAMVAETERKFQKGSTERPKFSLRASDL